ncbi:MAG: hypothetical protein AAF942_08335, partial [Pseudomonadota bacterium]
VVMSLARGDEDPVLNLLDAITRIRQDYRHKAHFLFVMRSDGTLAFEEARTRYRRLALERDIPAFDEIPAAAMAVSAIATHERHLAAGHAD